MGSSTENSAYGPTRNPWDPTRVPGGSGGGSAAAVSAGLAPWALGSDTGGSIKQPSALCGNVGLRPTYGTVSRFGAVAFASSLDQIGPVARNGPRLRLPLLDHRRPRRERLDDRRRPRGGDAGPGRRGAARACASALPTELNEAEGIEPGVREAVRRAIALAEELGAEVEECSLPRSVEYGLACYYLVAPAEASSNLARYDGVRYGVREDGADFREMVMRSRHDGIGDEPKRRIMLGTYALSAGYRDAFYGKAQQVRTVIRREHDELFERFDVLLSPTSPTVAFRLGEKSGDPLAMYLSDLLTIPSCMAGPAGPHRSRAGSPRGCPSGCSSSGRSSARTRSSARGTRSSGRSASTSSRPGSRRVPMSATAWEPVIGLEIHVQLKTRTKMFCGCANGFGGGENTQDVPDLPRPPRRAAGAEPRARSS